MRAAKGSLGHSPGGRCREDGVLVRLVQSRIGQAPLERQVEMEEVKELLTIIRDRESTDSPSV